MLVLAIIRALLLSYGPKLHTSNIYPCPAPMRALTHKDLMHQESSFDASGTYELRHWTDLAHTGRKKTQQLWDKNRQWKSSFQVLTATSVGKTACICVSLSPTHF